MNIIKTYEILDWLPAPSPAVSYIFSSALLYIELAFYRKDTSWHEIEAIVRDPEIPEWIIYEDN